MLLYPWDGCQMSPPKECPEPWPSYSPVPYAMYPWLQVRGEVRQHNAVGAESMRIA